MFQGILRASNSFSQYKRGAIALRNSIDSGSNLAKLRARATKRFGFNCCVARRSPPSAAAVATPEFPVLFRGSKRTPSQFLNSGIMNTLQHMNHMKISWAVLLSQLLQYFFPRNKLGIEIARPCYITSKAARQPGVGVRAISYSNESIQRNHWLLRKINSIIRAKFLFLKKIK